jgi:hypothetical protein
VVGSLVANNYKSSMILVPLLRGRRRQPVNYHELSQVARRHPHQVRQRADAKVNIYVIGFAKLAAI